MKNCDCDAIVVGTGWAGVVCARGLADRGMKVLVLDKRDHIGGNMYDYWDKHELLIHKYGPHIMMTNNVLIVNAIKKYDDIRDVEVLMETYVDDKVVPLPINFNSINMLFGADAGQSIRDMLCANYQEEEVSIFELINSKSDLIHDFAEEIFNKVFLGYNQKMWGGVLLTWTYLLSTEYQLDCPIIIFAAKNYIILSLLTDIQNYSEKSLITPVFRLCLALMRLMLSKSRMIKSRLMIKLHLCRLYIQLQ